MPKLRVESLTISQDGFGAGSGPDLNNLLGVGGTSLHGWAVPARTFQKAYSATPLRCGAVAMHYRRAR